MNGKLRDCYNQIKEIPGNDIEPYESVALVEEYRHYWKPAKTRVILLAESHVFTSDEDRRILIPQRPDLPSYPMHYVKFVYCLAYGEKQLTGNPSHPKRDGTPQFWKVFYSCDGHIADKNDFIPVLSDTDDKQRLKNKIELLLRLKQKGIWLIDSSIVALYNTGKKPKNSIISSVIRKSWDGYTRGVIADADPKHIICVGKTVANVLRDGIKKLVGERYTVVYQPNAHLSSEAHMANVRQFSRICCGD